MLGKINVYAHCPAGEYDEKLGAVGVLTKRPHFRQNFVLSVFGWCRDAADFKTKQK